MITLRKKKKKKEKKKKKDPLIIPVLCTPPRSIANPSLESLQDVFLAVLLAVTKIKTGSWWALGCKIWVPEGVRHVTECVSKVKLYAFLCILVFERQVCGKDGPKDAK